MHELRIDVSISAPGAAPPLQIAATAFIPSWHSDVTRATAIFAVPGGGYSRGYFDMHFPQHAGYANSSDITVHVVPRMAHMHNFAGTRELLWARLEQWTRGIAGSGDES
jgi:hypothetical protein